MRRPLVLASLAFLILAMLPAAVTAAPLSRVHEEAVIVSCAGQTEDGFAAVFATDSNLYGSYADLVFWDDSADPTRDDPTLINASADVQIDPTSVAVTFELVTYDPESGGDPAGSAVLTATLTPDGDPIEVAERYRDGNTWGRVAGTIQPLSVDGSLTLPGDDLDPLVNCFAEAQSLTYTNSDPAAFVQRFEQSIVACEWVDEDGFVGLFAFSDAFASFGDVFVSSEDGEFGGGGEATLTDTALSLSAELRDFQTDAVAGDAEASGTLTSTGTTIRTRDRDGRQRTKITANLSSISGSLDVTLDGTTTTYALDDEHCYAAQERIFFHSVNPSGPKAKPLANDAPEDAKPLRLGQTARTVTGANAFEPEAPCSAVYPFETEPVDVPITYTAWWTVTGTGGEMTASTVGSDFDTVLGVYVMGPDGLEQVVCVDDTIETGLQAVATWSSVAGTTYYLQVGGFDGSAGRLTLVVEAG